jgi:hypothetical protein
MNHRTKYCQILIKTSAMPCYRWHSIKKKFREILIRKAEYRNISNFHADEISPSQVEIAMKLTPAMLHIINKQEG